MTKKNTIKDGETRKLNQNLYKKARVQNEQLAGYCCKNNIRKMGVEKQINIERNTDIYICPRDTNG